MRRQDVGRRDGQEKSSHKNKKLNNSCTGDSDCLFVSCPRCLDKSIFEFFFENGIRIDINQYGCIDSGMLSSKNVNTGK